MESLGLQNAPKFKTPEEEVAFLRAHIAERENALIESGREVPKEQIAHEALNQYRHYEPAEAIPGSASPACRSRTEGRQAACSGVNAENPAAAHVERVPSVGKLYSLPLIFGAQFVKYTSTTSKFRNIFY